MTKLFILNFILIIIIVLILYLLKKYCKIKKSIYIIFLIVPISTILCHYSSLLYHYIVNETGMIFLKENPNLLLPIYPCNIVMWLCLVLGIIKNKESKLGLFLIDYIFWFGIFSSLVGMFVNIDFMNNPTLLDYDVTKGIIAHALLLLNSLLLPVFGYIKIKLEKNFIHMIISVIMMYIIGLYCNLLFKTLVSAERAYHINSMFIIHSPFEGIPYLKYPVIAGIALVLYFIIFAICEVFIYKKEERWYHRIKKYKFFE